MNYEQRTMNYELRLSAVALAKAETTNYEQRTTNYFIQNKPNFPNAQMNITSVISMNYEQRTTNYFLQNKPNQTQFQPANLPIESMETKLLNFHNKKK